MKKIYLLLLAIGIFAACKKNNDTPAPERKLDIYDIWEEDRPVGLSQSDTNRFFRTFVFAEDLSYVYFAGGSSGRESERGVFTVTNTANPDSCVIRMTPNNGNPVRTLEIKFSADKYGISIPEFGQYRRRSWFECSVIL